MEKRIREVRNHNGISQTEFGKRIGMTRSMISNLELGLVDINDYAVKLICTEFNVSEEWLRTGKGEMFETAVEDLVAQLAKEHDLGPGGTAFLRVIVQIFDAVGPDEMENIFANVIPQIRAQAAAGLASGDEPLIGMLNDRQISGDAEQESV